MKYSESKTKELRELGKLSFQAGDLSSAKRHFEELNQYEVDNVQTTIYLARIHNQLSRYPEAIEKWKVAYEKKPQLKEPLIQLARLHAKIENRADALEYFKKYLDYVPDHKESINNITKLQEELLHINAPKPTFPLNHIAIGGISYSGSTVLSWILGSLNTVENIGESHWLTRKRKIRLSNGNGRDETENTSQVATPCYTCGNTCNQLNNEFRNSLKIDPSNWYFKIAQQLQCNTLVSADKNWIKYKKLDPLLRMNAIVLFKSPEQAWFSNYRKLSLEMREMTPVQNVQNYKKAWINAYTNYIRGFENTGTKIFLSFDHFCLDPKWHLEKLCEALSLDYDQNALTAQVLGQHCFGGNPIANGDQKRVNCNTISIKPLPTPDIPVEHKRYLEGCDDLQDLYHDLMNRYLQDFSRPLTQATA